MQDQIIDSPNDVSDASERRMREALEMMSRPKAQDAAPSRPAQPNFAAQRSNAPKPQQQQKGPPQKMPDGARPRRRFAQDGDVPVVLVGRSREADPAADSKLAGMTKTLENERHLRIQAQRNADMAQGMIQSLKTQVAHAELTIQEMRNAERALRAELETAQQGLAEARLAVTLAAKAATVAAPVVETAVIADAAEASGESEATDLFGAPAAVAAPAPAKRGRKPKMAQPVSAEAATGMETEIGAAPAEGDQPVEWWLPSFRHQKPSRRRKGS